VIFHQGINDTKSGNLDIRVVDNAITIPLFRPGLLGACTSWILDSDNWLVVGFDTALIHNANRLRVTVAVLSRLINEFDRVFNVAEQPA
jgi:hypothetical protein